MIVYKSFLKMFLLGGLFLFLPINGQSQSNIILDGYFADWDEVSSHIEDVLGDVGPQKIDFGQLKVQSDDQYLYLYIDLSLEINLQNDNDLAIYIDADNNPNTGFAEAGIGAELRYFPGRREGFIHVGNSLTAVGHDNVGLTSLPTVTSDKFEMYFSRILMSNLPTVSLGNQIRVVIKDESSNGDQLPDGDGGVLMELSNVPYSEIEISVEKEKSEYLRVVSYNVLNDGPFTGRAPAIERVLKALKPDIIGFQEIYEHDADQILDFIEDIFPGEIWYGESVFSDVHLISKYTITDTEPISGNGSFLVEKDDVQMMITLAHFPCCDNDIERQSEVDMIMAFTRNEISSGGANFSLKNNSPIIIMGDMNFVGLKEQVSTLIDGDIKQNNTYGPDFDPNWGNGPLLDANPRTLGRPSAVTWINPSSSFAPGKLDWMVYGGDLQIKKSFAFDTEKLTGQELNELDVLSTDTRNGSDHVPLVADFAMGEVTSISKIKKKDQFEVFPLPAHDQLSIVFKENVPVKGGLNVSIFNASSQVVLSAQISADQLINQINISDLPAGIYLIKINNELKRFIKK